MGKYQEMLEAVFFELYKEGDTAVIMSKEKLEDLNSSSNYKIKNLADAIYSARSRGGMPKRIAAIAPEGKEWIIRSPAKSIYEFVLVELLDIVPKKGLFSHDILNSTPDIITSYALQDEQALLADVRYNRLVDIFLGIACYSLQSHLRSSVSGSQIEIDELYVGVDRSGEQFIIPVEAKEDHGIIGQVQIENGIGFAAERYPGAKCIPLAVQWVNREARIVCIFKFAMQGDSLKIEEERHYRIVDHVR